MEKELKSCTGVLLRPDQLGMAIQALSVDTNSTFLPKMVTFAHCTLTFTLASFEVEYF